MTDEIYYLKRLASGVGTFFMKRLSSGEGIYFMSKKPTIYEWRYIGRFRFLGTDASTGFDGTPGSFVGCAGTYQTTAISIKVQGVSGYWTDGGPAGHLYRGNVDIKSAIAFAHISDEKNDTVYGFATAGEASACWASGNAEIEIGSDGTFGWGAYEDPAGNTGACYFDVWGYFEV